MNYFGKLDLDTDSSIMSKDEYENKICKKIQKKEKKKCSSHILINFHLRSLEKNFD